MIFIAECQQERRWASGVVQLPNTGIPALRSFSASEYALHVSDSSSWAKLICCLALSVAHQLSSRSLHYTRRPHLRFLSFDFRFSFSKHSLYSNTNQLKVDIEDPPFLNSSLAHFLLYFLFQTGPGVGGHGFFQSLKRKRREY